MKTTKLFLILIWVAGLCALPLLCTGCLGYGHSRTVSVKHPDGTEEKKTERTVLGTAWKKGEAALANSSVTDHPTNGYTRNVGAKNVKTSGDAETMKATGGAVGEGAKAVLGLPISE